MRGIWLIIGKYRDRSFISHQVIGLLNPFFPPVVQWLKQSAGSSKPIIHRGLCNVYPLAFELLDLPVKRKMIPLTVILI